MPSIWAKLRVNSIKL